MNLSHIVPLTVGQKKLPTTKRKELFEIQTEIRVLAKHREARESLGQQQDKLVAAGWAMAEEGYVVPTLGNIVDRPRTTTADARTIADRVGFLVMPFEYLSGKYAPPYSQQNDIEKLTDFSLYVMAPISAYSLAKHIAGKDAPIHVPEDAAQAFLALSMSVPVFRAMQRQLEELREHVRDYRERVHALEGDVASLKARMDDLTTQVARQRAEQAAVKVEQERQTQAIRNWMLSASDPLILALPEGKTIRDDCLAIVGPAWGELPMEIVKILGLKPMKVLPKAKASR